MPVAAIATERAPFTSLRALLASRWLWCLAAVAALGLRDWVGDPHALGLSLGDTDDATRLTQVRELMAGAPWLDTTLPRFGGATPLLSHWSRLIDLPIALIIALAGLFVAPDTAETVARIVWPSLLLLGFLRLLVREAELRAGQAGAVMMLIFGGTCLSGLYQFSVGRIDHHNVMILGAVGGLIVMARALEAPRYGWHAGALLGLALAVGYEPLALIIPAIVIATVLATVFPAWLEGVRNTTVALAATLAGGLFITVPAARWLTVTCDALAMNMVLLAAAGAAGLWYVHANRDRFALPARLGIMAAAGAAGSLMYLGIEPVCIAGPFAQVDPAVGPIWLSHVVETRSVFERSHDMPMAMAVFVAACLIGIVAQAITWHYDRTANNLFLLIAVAIALPPAIWQVKLTFYAVWLATFTLAIAIAGLKGSDGLSPLTMRLAGATLANQGTLALLATPLLVGAGLSGAAVATTGPEPDLCHETPTIQSLRALPPGFMIADIDSGPYIVALTHHDVLSAPYHRIDKAILAEHAVLAGPAAGSESRVRAVLRHQAQGTRPTYIVLCAPPTGAAPKPNTGATGPAAKPVAGSSQEPTKQAGPGQTVSGSPHSKAAAMPILLPQQLAQSEVSPKGSRADATTLAGALLTGAQFGYLEAVEVHATREALKVWRVLPPRP